MGQGANFWDYYPGALSSNQDDSSSSNGYQGGMTHCDIAILFETFPFSTLVTYVD